MVNIFLKKIPICFALVLFSCSNSKFQANETEPIIITKNDSFIVFPNSSKQLTFIASQIGKFNVLHKQPTYYVDSINDKIYFYPSKRVLYSYTISTGKLVNYVDLWADVNENNLKLSLYKNNLIFESENQIKIFDDKLRMRASLFDTLFDKSPLCNNYINKYTLQISHDTLNLRLVFKDLQTNTQATRLYVFLINEHNIKLSETLNPCKYPKIKI